MRSLPTTPPGLKLALLNPVYWPEVRRGSERMLHDLASGLIANGHRPTLITSHPQRPSRVNERGLEVLRVRRPSERALRRAGVHEHVLHAPGSWARLRRGDYDLAHSFYVSDALVATEWGARKGRPVIFSVMGIPTEHARRGAIRSRAWKRALARSDAVVTLSRAAQQALTASGVDSEVIYPGVDLERFKPSEDRSKTPAILCPAALDDPRKRVRFLAETFPRIRRSIPGARLIIGSPPGAAVPPELRSEGIELRDLDQHETLVRSYSEAWLTVLPSRAEAFGLVLIESLACGTPVIGTREGGIPEIVDDPALGRLFEPDDPDSLADAIIAGLDLIADSSTVSTCLARARTFGFDACLNAHLTLYERISRG